jgi:Transposase.
MLRWKFCFDCQGIVYYDFIPEGKTVNKYTDIIHHLRDAIRRKRPEKWRTNSWFLLYNNAPAHRSVLVKDFLAENNMTTLENHTYSPDVAATDFYLFPRPKSALK